MTVLFRSWPHATRVKITNLAILTKVAYDQLVTNMVNKHTKTLLGSNYEASMAVCLTEQFVLQCKTSNIYMSQN